MTNNELAHKLKDLRDFLIIAGYEESHATRYTQIARLIEKMPEPIETVEAEGRLTDIPGVGKLVAMYIREILTTGVSSKQRDWEQFAPVSVLELVRIEGIAAKTAKRLFQEFGIDGLASLKLALDSGILDDVSGIGPKTKAEMMKAVKAISGA